METDFIKNMFILGIPWFEKILRLVVIYIFLIIGLRLAGKRELAQLNPIDFVVLFTLSNSVQNAIIGGDNSVIGGIISASTLLLINHLFIRFLYGKEKLIQIVEGGSTVLVENGQVKADMLKKELITTCELEEAAHQQGFASIDEVDKATIEAGGAICFMGKKPEATMLRHQEILDKLEGISQDLAKINSTMKISKA